MIYPRLISAEGACPPEDCGGPLGYGAYLEAIADPANERHREMLEWRGAEFDPTVVDEALIRTKLAVLAARRKQKKPARSIKR